MCGLCLRNRVLRHSQQRVSKANMPLRPGAERIGSTQTHGLRHASEQDRVDGLSCQADQSDDSTHSVTWTNSCSSSLWINRSRSFFSNSGSTSYSDSKVS